jgi:hypothetical protein
MCRNLVTLSYLTRDYMIINQNGTIPFTAAYGGGHISLAGLLIKANADVNRTDAVRFRQQRCGNETFCDNDVNDVGNMILDRCHIDVLLHCHSTCIVMSIL